MVKSLQWVVVTVPSVLFLSLWAVVSLLYFLFWPLWIVVVKRDRQDMSFDCTFWRVTLCVWPIRIAFALPAFARIKNLSAFIFCLFLPFHLFVVSRLRWVWPFPLSSYECASSFLIADDQGPIGRISSSKTLFRFAPVLFSAVSPSFVAYYTREFRAFADDASWRFRPTASQLDGTYQQ